MITEILFSRHDRNITEKKNQSKITELNKILRNLLKFVFFTLERLICRQFHGLQFEFSRKNTELLKSK